MDPSDRETALLKLMVSQVAEDERWRRDLDDETTDLLLDWASRRIKDRLTTGIADDDERPIQQARHLRIALACLAHLICNGPRSTVEARRLTWQELSTSLPAATGQLLPTEPGPTFTHNNFWNGTPAGLASRLLTMIDSLAGGHER